MFENGELSYGANPINPAEAGDAKFK